MTEPNKTRLNIQKLWYYKQNRQPQPILCLLQESNHNVRENIRINKNPLWIQVHSHIANCTGVQKNVVFFCLISHNAHKCKSLCQTPIWYSYQSWLLTCCTHKLWIQWHFPYTHRSKNNLPAELVLDLIIFPILSICWEYEGTKPRR